MSVTFAQLWTRALHDDFSPDKYLSIAQEAINEALGTLWRRTGLSRSDLRATVSFASGVTDATIPGLARLERVWLDQGAELDYIGPDDLERVLDRSPSGTPLYWTLTGSATADATLRIAPSPSVGEIVEYVGRGTVAQLVNDSDVAPLPDDFAWSPYKYARGVMFGFEEDPDLAAYWRGLFSEDLIRLRVAMAAGQHAGPRIVGGTWSNVDSGPTLHHPQGLW